MNYAALVLLTAARPLRALSLPPPLVDGTTRLSFREVASRACTCVEAALADGHRRVSVEIPQISTNSSSFVQQFEDERSFLLTLVELLGGGRAPTPVGCNVEIADNWRASGEYLTEEGLYGYRFPGLNLRQPQAGAVTLLANSEIGFSALRELKELDDGRGTLLLFNIPLDRLSFFDKLGVPSLDDVEAAYQLRRGGAGGFVSREYPGEFCAWRLGSQDAEAAPVLIASQPDPFRPKEIEAALGLPDQMRFREDVDPYG